MPSQKNETLHGSAPDISQTALLMIDVINDMNFKGGRDLFEYALPMAKRLRTFKEKVKKNKIPVIYVNDNYGRWNSDRDQIISHALKEGNTGKLVTELLKPEEDDYFIIKPKHSGFFSTNLGTLLAYLKVQRVILTGLQTDICVLFTANDAFMRNYQIYVPEDCVASEKMEDHTSALKKMENLLRADITPSTKLEIERLSQHVNFDLHPHIHI